MNNIGVFYWFVVCNVEFLFDQYILKYKFNLQIELVHWTLIYVRSTSTTSQHLFEEQPQDKLHKNSYDFNKHSTIATPTLAFHRSHTLSAHPRSTSKL